MFKKVLAIVIAAVLCLGIFAGCTGNNKKEVLGESEALLPAPAITKDFDVPATFKIGFICLHDENSTYDNNFIKAAKAVKEALGLTDDQFILKTNIPESDACFQAASELADKGCSIVFADSFGHDSFMLQAAKKYPNVQFCHATGTMAHDNENKNYHNAFANIFEGRYCAGIAAGEKLNEMIKNKEIKEEEAVIGYVGAFTYAEVISGMTSFYLGARSVCDSVKMKVRYTGSWYDQPKEAAAAEALITEDDCVLISQHADSLGAPATCEKYGVPNISYNGSTYDAGPNTFIISSAINWQIYFTYIIKCVCTGAEIATDWCGGISDGAVILSGINQDVMAEGTIDKINNAIKEFKAGTLHVFDTSKFTVTVKDNVKDTMKLDKDGHLTEYLADVNGGDYVGDTNVIHDGYFDESGKNFRSAPFFDIIIDGIENKNVDFGKE